jgi:hypothetical protein
MMSVRDALYDIMFDDENPYRVNRSEILVDIVHGGRAGPDWAGLGRTGRGHGDGTGCARLNQPGLG